MKIKDVEIKRFKSIYQLSFSADNLTSIVGKNNYGKTAIFEAILVFFGKRKLTDADIHMHTSDFLPEISVTFQNVSPEDITLLLGSDYDLDYAYENYLNGEVSISLSFSKITDKFNSIYKIQPENKRIASRNLADILPNIKYVSSIRNPTDNTFSKKNNNLTELMALLIDTQAGDSISFEGQELKIQEIKNALKKHEEFKVKSLSEELTSRFQNLIGNTSLSINVEVEKTEISHFHETKITDHDIKSDKNDGASFSLLSSGTGMQSIMILAILEAYINCNIEKDFILIIEEPEVYLHPSLQRKMINVLNHISNSNQIFISTHSPIVVSQIKQSDLIYIKKDQGLTTKAASDPAFIINELGIKPDDIFQYTKVLFVEGPDDKTLIEAIIKKLAKKGQIDGSLINSLKIVDVGGIDTLNFYANAKILDAMNHVHNSSYQFWIMVDSDGYSKEEVQSRIEQNISAFSNIYNKENLLILNEYAIESYFIDPHILCNLFEELDFKIVKQLCEKYFSVYEKNLNSHSNNHSNFQQKFKPKHFFITKETVFYEKTWLLKENEILNLNNIQLNWSHKHIENYIDTLPLDVIQNSKMNELVENVKGIFNQLQLK
ncbi:AAA family ATPase [Pseudomonas sp. R2.Fl]|nr:AAA family ATPase [Pseudomonas sp. R2.Fl]